MFLLKGHFTFTQARFVVRFQNLECFGFTFGDVLSKFTLEFPANFFRDGVTVQILTLCEFRIFYEISTSEFVEIIAGVNCSVHVIQQCIGYKIQKFLF